MDDVISRQAAMHLKDLHGAIVDGILYIPLLEVINHLEALPSAQRKGRWIDVDMLCEKMYHEAFETDSDEQRWDSGCWIRYKMFQRVVNSMPILDISGKEGE